MSKSKLLLTAIAMTLSSSLYAQNHKFAGTVVDANGEPIIGATVNVKGSKENAITDIDGRFSISAAPGQTLVINYIGFSPLETKAADNMQLTLNEDRQTLNDVVVVGYGVQKKSVVTASIASYTTAAGSAPSLCFTIGTPTRSAQIDNWSAAAARNVSPAAMITFLPSLV